MASSRKGFYSIDECVNLPTATLQQEAARNFVALVDIAVAEAVRDDMPASTRAWLRSPEQVEPWIDALSWAASSLQSSTAWKAFTRDGRLIQAARLQNRVRARLNEAHALRKQQQVEQFRNSEAFQNEINPEWRARRWLARYFEDEAASLRAAIAHDMGIPPTNPVGSGKPQHWGEYLEIAHQRGLIHVDVSDEVQRVRDLPDGDFDRVVRQDAAAHEDLVQALRHPLVLHRWHEALGRLARETQAGNVKNMTLPKVPQAEWESMTEQDVAYLVGKRRWFSAYAQRSFECKMLSRPLLAAARDRSNEQNAPWIALVEAVRDELIRRHPAEYAYIRGEVGAALQELAAKHGEPLRLLGRDASALRDRLFGNLDRGTLQASPDR